MTIFEEKWDGFLVSNKEGGKSGKGSGEMGWRYDWRNSLIGVSDIMRFYMNFSHSPSYSFPRVRLGMVHEKYKRQLLGRNPFVRHVHTELHICPRSTRRKNLQKLFLG